MSFTMSVPVVRLEERLPMQDDAADVFRQTRRGVAHGAVRSAILGGVRNGLGIRVPRAQPRTRRLVRRKESLARTAQALGRGFELGKPFLRHHGTDRSHGCANGAKSGASSCCVRGKGSGVSSV